MCICSRMSRTGSRIWPAFAMLALAMSPINALTVILTIVLVAASAVIMILITGMTAAFTVILSMTLFGSVR